jgi:uncharacterized protein (DUF1800 family)
MNHSTADHSWESYEPNVAAPWNLQRVVHLHRRTSFAATWSELQRDLKDGPKASIDRLLAGNSRSEGVPRDFAATSAMLLERAAQDSDVTRLKAWWMYRMLFGLDPLGERLTLLWHNHFATNATKVGFAVRRQNEIFREYARAPFGELLKHVVHDPALLVWLDAQANRKDHPNENLGRELMELFTLGIGHFTESDVKEAARVLTGWTLAGDVFREDASLHDNGDKTVLGHKGHWKGDDLIRILLEQPATAERLAGRICEMLMGEEFCASASKGVAGAERREAPVSGDGPGLQRFSPGHPVIDPARQCVHALADGLREHDLNIGWAVETVLRSQAFFADSNLGTRIVGPVEYVIGSARVLELFDPPPNTLVLAEFAANLGQDLFHPPNVGGWPGGRSWITTRSAIGRYNFALALVGGDEVGRSELLNVFALAERHGRRGDLKSIIAYYAELLLGFLPSETWQERILNPLGPKATSTPEIGRQAVALILASPDAQLG